jgi:hypothetical protein
VIEGGLAPLMLVCSGFSGKATLQIRKVAFPKKRGGGMPRAVRRRSATRQTDCLLPDVEPLSPAGEADPGRGLEQVDVVAEKS